MEFSQSAARTTNRSIHVASRVRTIPGRSTNSDLTLPRARIWKALLSASSLCTREVLRHLPTRDKHLLTLSCMLSDHHLHLRPKKLTIAMTNYSHAPTVISFRGSSAGVRGNSTTTTTTIMMVMMTTTTTTKSTRTIRL